MIQRGCVNDSRLQCSANHVHVNVDGATCAHSSARLCSVVKKCGSVIQVYARREAMMLKVNEFTEQNTIRGTGRKYGVARCNISTLQVGSCNHCCS